MLAAWWSMPAGAITSVAWSLLPQPAGMHPDGRGTVTIGDGAVVKVSGAQRARTLAIARRFAQRIADIRGLHLRVTAKEDAHALIAFAIDPAAAIAGDEGYRIVIGESGIQVIARSSHGLFDGSVTLWQFLTPPGWVRGAPAHVADGTIDDHPRFAWRSLLLDSGRHFQSVSDIEKLIDWMSLHKLDVLLWHLTEDQGWRLEIPKYPLLTKIGACRKAVGLDIELAGSADKPYCGFYDEAQMREVVRYAADRFVTVVPGIDVPGHSQAAVAAYPWLGVTGKRPQVWTDWGVSPWLLRPDRKTLQFMEDVLDEVMRVFPSTYISLGGDEADKTQWNASSEVRAQMRELGLANMDQLQGWFTGEIAKYLVEHGRIPLSWDDELLAGATLPTSEVVMSWHGQDGARVALQAIEQGHDVVMSPQESLYFDHYQSDLPDEWPGQPGAIALRQVYDTIVIPQGATDAQAAHVLGVQGQLWTELMTTFANDTHALFPRMAALSELAWSPADAHDWDKFIERIPAELARYRALGIAYGDGAFAPAFALAATKDGVQVTLSNQTNFGDIRYTTDGSTPVVDSDRYVAPLAFSADAKVMLRATTFAPDGFALSAPRAKTIDAAALATRSGSELETCSGQPPMRLAGDRAASGARPVYAVGVGDMCWLWKNAPLDDVGRISLTVARVTWQFGDERAGATVRPAASATGEFEVHIDSCAGPVLATLPLARAAAVVGETTLTADVPTQHGADTRTLCIVATGDPREGQWAIADVSFSPRAN
ncbi:MAG TPA: family 20 glycosylhydrolase [Rhodanobacteraceae bacterium]